MKNAKVIAFANQKGGAGKTTASINISSILASKGFKVLLIDTDSQAHSVKGFGLNPRNITKTLTHILENMIKNDGDLNDQVSEFIIPTNENVFLLPCDIGIASLETSISGIAIGRERLLKKVVDTQRDQYDYIIIDCPPALGNITINVLTACDYVIIPTEASVFAFDGTAQLTRTIEKIKEIYNPELSVLGVLVTRYKVGTIHSEEIIDALKENFSEKYTVFSALIPDSIRASESNGEGESLLKYSPNEKITEIYKQATDEVIHATKE